MFHLVKADLEALAQVNPWLALGAGIAKQAIKDYRLETDPVKSAEAFCWLLGAGALWLGCLGLEITEDQFFEKVVHGESSRHDNQDN